MKRWQRKEWIRISLALTTVTFCLISAGVTSAGVWVTNSPLNTGRYGHTASLLSNGQVLIVGGNVSGSTTNLTNTELFNPTNNTWTSVGSMRDDRTGHTATVLANGKVLVTGGNGAASTLNTTELFDPITGTWETNVAMNVSRIEHTATLLLDGRVLVAGGYSGVLPSGAMLASAEIYDPIARTWTMTGSLTNSRKSFTATLLPSGKVLAVGGVGGVPGVEDYGLLSSAELYDPNLGAWTAVGSMATPRQFHTATLLPDGKVLVTGGMGYTNDVPDSEVYDLFAQIWTNAGALNFPRALQTATLMPSGKILMAGGWSTFGHIPSPATTELYDVPAATWAPAAPLNFVRAYHTTTLLPDSRVLVVGGLGDGNISATTELYLEVAPLRLTDPGILSNGAFQFGFTNTPGLKFGVFASSNLSQILSNWTSLGDATEISPGVFQFTDPQATNYPRRLYRVRAN